MIIEGDQELFGSNLVKIVLDRMEGKRKSLAMVCLKRAVSQALNEMSFT